MIIPINKDNYMMEWLKLIVIFKNNKNSKSNNVFDNKLLSLSPTSVKVFEAIARYKRAGKNERYEISKLLGMSEASLGNYIKKLKDLELIKKVKEKNTPYYYTCTFPVPNSVEQLLSRKEVITFKLVD